MGEFLKRKARRQVRAFFIGCIAMCQLVWHATVGADSLCATDRIHERVRVSHVYDGDTLSLRDGRRVRLIGMDAPEIGREGRPHEAMAIASRDYLRRLVFGHGQVVALRFDQEQHDLHGRVLAHAFLPDGANLTAQLLAQGYAYQIAIPPNLWSSGCYRKVSQEARSARRGIWKLQHYRPAEAGDLPQSVRGMRVVTGLVTRTGRGGRTTWVELDNRIGLRIEDDDLRYFRGWQFDRLQGQRLEATGSIYRRKGQLRMQIRHPSALRRTGAVSSGHGQVRRSYRESQG